MTMPYIKNPTWAKTFERFALTVAYTMLLIAGILTMFYPLTPTGFWFGLAQTLCSASAVFGIISGRYRWEWVVLPVLVAIQLISAIVLVNLVTSFFTVYMLAVMFFLGRRLIHLTAVAQYLRSIT